MTPLIGPSITRVLKRWYDNSLDNVGEPNRSVTLLRRACRHFTHFVVSCGMALSGHKLPLREQSISF